MLNLFGGKDKAGGGAATNERVSRHSSGWGQLLDRMRGEESLRVLDIGNDIVDQHQLCYRPGP